MSCCAPPLALDGASDPSAARQEIRLASRDLGNGLRQSDLSVPGLHCAACIRAVETGLARLPGVAQVRVNLSTRRAAVQWRGEEAPDLLTALAELGYPGIDASAWFGLVAPAGTQTAVVDQMNRGVNQALAQPELQRKLTSIGAVAMPGDAQVFAAFVQAERDRWLPVARDLGLKAQ